MSVFCINKLSLRIFLKAELQSSAKQVNLGPEIIHLQRMGGGEMGEKSDGILRELISPLPQSHSQIHTATFSAKLLSEPDFLIFQNLEVIEISGHRHHRGVARIIGAFSSAHYNAHPLHLSSIMLEGKNLLELFSIFSLALKYPKFVSATRERPC